MRGVALGYNVAAAQLRTFVTDLVTPLKRAWHSTGYPYATD